MPADEPTEKYNPPVYVDLQLKKQQFEAELKERQADRELRRFELEMNKPKGLPFTAGQATVVAANPNTRQWDNRRRYPRII
jgi:hypothetical protein